jgi:hypothetical protein
MLARLRTSPETPAERLERPNAFAVQLQTKTNCSLMQEKIAAILTARESIIRPCRSHTGQEIERR